MGVPSIGMLTQMGQGYAPLAPGISPRMTTGLEGVPLLGDQTPMAMFANLALAPYFQRMMGQVGMTPMGVGHDQNMYDVMRNMQFQQFQVQAMQQAAQADRSNFMKTFQGVAAITGQPFGADQRQAAGALSDILVSAAPILAQTMPDLVDQFGGMRGSASVMANRFMQAGRYRLDPVSGRMGLDPAAAGGMARTLYQDLYSDANISSMQGVTAGQLGSLFQELQSRGMMPTAYSSGLSRRGATFDALTGLSRTDYGQLTSAAGAVGVDITKGIGSLSGEDLDKLASTPEVSDRLRAFDTERVKRSLKAYTSAVSAMRDIFGDAGMPNAPMQELVQGLEALTLGQMHQMDPAKMGMMVRQTYALARNTGMSMDGVMALQQHAAGRAQALGLPQVYALDARYGGMSYGGAYRAMGMGAHSGWNMMTADQLTQADTNLRLQGASSNVANRLNVLMRVADTHGLDPNSEAGRLAAAIRNGRDEYVGADGKTRSVAMTDDRLISMLQGATGRDGQSLNLSENDARELLTQRTTNLQFGNRYNVGDIVRGRPQRDERQADIARGVAETMRFRLRERLIAGGMDAVEADEKSRQAAGSTALSITQRMMGLTAPVFSDNGLRDEAVGKIMQEELAKAGIDVSGAGAEDFLRGTASSAYGRSEENLKRFGTSMQNVRALYDPEVLNQAGRLRWQARHDSEIRESLSSLGRHTFLSRIVDAIQGADPNDPDALQRAAMSALGGVDSREIAQGLQTQLQDVARRKQAMDAKLDEINNTTDETKRAQLTSELDAMRSEYGGAIEGLKKIGERHGLNDAMLTGDDVNRAVGAMDKVMQVSAPNLDLPTDDRVAAFKKFWESKEGDTFKQNVGFSTRQVDDVVDKLLTSPTLVKRFGSEALQMAETLQKNQQQLRDLADFHTGGDMSRLLAKDFDIDTSTEEGKQLYNAVNAEMTSLLGSSRTILDTIKGKQAAGGRQFDPVREAILLTGQSSGPEYEAALKKLQTAKQLTVEDELLLEQQREWDASLPEETRKTMKGYQDNEARITALAAKSGLSRESLMGGSEALSTLAAAQKQAEEHYTRPSDQIVREVYESLGMGDKLGDDPAAFNKSQMQLMTLLGSTEGRRFASRLVGTQEILKSAASQGKYFSGDANSAAGVDAMSLDYANLFDADGKMDAAKTAEFQKRIGVDVSSKEGQEKWASFEKSMQWQRQIKLDQVQKPGAKLDDTDVLNIFTQGTSGGSAGPSGTKPLPIVGHLTGTFTIKGDKADMVGIAGGSRNFTTSAV